jgi:hypothetical protein
MELLTANGEVAEEHVINRPPLPTLAEKFGRWMSRFRWSVG